MLQIGKNDVFERKYMQKFREFAGDFGEFVSYERDRGARDIGLHFTRKLQSGKEIVTSALCWFQMKGIMASSLSAAKFEKLKHIPVSLEVSHLQYWYIQSVPTYLVLYIESVDSFLILNLQEYVRRHWGRQVMALSQKTLTVTVPKNSPLDSQAFNLILAKHDIAEWGKILGAKENHARLCRRDYELIWRLGTADKRKVLHRIEFWAWQSKCRSQFYIQEATRKDSKKWTNVREHWQYMMDVSELEQSYPYLEVSAHEELWGDEDEQGPVLSLKNGDEVIGVDCSGEYICYTFNICLNKLGKQLFDFVKVLKKIGIVEVGSGNSEFLSIAPWHGRSV